MSLPVHELQGLCSSSDEDSSHGSADDDVDVSLLPKIQLENVAVPRQVRGWRQSRDLYRKHVFQLLYEGSWRMSWPFITAHQWFYLWILAAISSPHQKRKPQKSSWKLRIAVEFLLSWMTRLRNKDHLVPFLLAISLYCYVNHAPTDVWQLLAFLRILYHKKVVKKFAMDMYKAKTRTPQESSRQIFIEAADNDFFLLKVGLQRTGKTHENVDCIQRVRHHHPEVAQFQVLANGGIFKRPASFQALFSVMDPVNNMLHERFLKGMLERELTARSTNPRRASCALRANNPKGMKSDLEYKEPLVYTSADSLDDTDM